LILASAIAMAGCSSSQKGSAVATTQPLAAKTQPALSNTQRIARGVDFLVKSQQPDGSWGTGLETRGTEIYSMVPGSHDAYRVGTSALCVMALREAIAAGTAPAGGKGAHDRGLGCLIAHGRARRDDGEVMYKLWAD